MRSWIDRSAIGLSGLCLLHCLAGSLLLVTLSSLGGLWSHEVHVVGLLLAMPIAVIGLWRGLKRHGRRVVVAIGGIGLFFMAAALLAAHGNAQEFGLTALGVSLLGVAHLLNLRWSAAR